MNLVANIIYVIHVCLIIFMVAAPFSNILALLILHVVFSVSLVLHWYANSNACCLTLMEAYFRGTTMDKTFINKIIEPIYVISENKLNSIIWTSTVILTIISIYNIYNHKKIDALFRSRSLRQVVENLY